MKDDIKIKFDIMKVVKNDKSNFFKELEGMELVVLHFKATLHVNDTILAPLHYEDYDKFFKWVFKEVKREWFCISETFEDFKDEYRENSDELAPSITDYLGEFVYVREYTAEDSDSDEYYKKYFNKRGI